jgi:hypothetical protein
MVIEADDLGLPGHDVTTVSKAAITPDAVRPSFEMATFPESGPVLHEVDEDATVRASPNNLSPTASFINMVRGTSPSMLELGVIPTSPVSFRHKVTQPLPASVSTSAPIRRHARRTPSASAPRCSAHLVKKAMGRSPAVATVQNILMEKLGLAQGPQLQSADFERYLQLFVEGLSESQVQLIKELFATVMLGQEEVGLALEEA